MKSIQITSLAKRIRLERLMKRLNQLVEINGSAQNGITRLAFTEEDRLARELIVNWMREAGLDIRVSPIRNIFGRLNPKNVDTPIVMTGSHIDTVVRGGKLDGTLGVVAAIEVAQVISEAQISLRHPLEVVCFVMEESSRFNHGYAFGSSVMTGQTISDDMLQARDRNGESLAQAIYEMRSKELGIQEEIQCPDNCLEAIRNYVKESRYPVELIKAFVELHIEQGPVLDALKKPIGAVTAIAAPSRLYVTFKGQQNHSGTTPMQLRKDALCAAAEVILAVERICKSLENVVGTVGVIEADPNVINVIPGKVRIAIDMRSTSAEMKTMLVNSVREEIARIANSRGILCGINMIAEESPQPLSEKIVSLIEKTSASLGIESHRLVSGAGHDAAQMAKAVKDTGMIFVPSRNGLSHDPQEWTDEKDILRGVQILLLVLLNLAQ